MCVGCAGLEQVADPGCRYRTPVSEAGAVGPRLESLTHQCINVHSLSVKGLLATKSHT